MVRLVAILKLLVVVITLLVAILKLLVSVLMLLAVVSKVLVTVLMVLEEFLNFLVAFEVSGSCPDTSPFLRVFPLLSFRRSKETLIC